MGHDFPISRSVEPVIVRQPAKQSGQVFIIDGRSGVGPS